MIAFSNELSTSRHPFLTSHEKRAKSQEDGTNPCAMQGWNLRLVAAATASIPRKLEL